MEKYISILRGINVSGQKKIKMADLKALYEQIGLTNVITYIQSGNVLFESPETDTSKIAASITAVIKKAYGFDVPVLVLTKQELIDAAKNNPYINQDTVPIEKLYITFLAEPARQENIKNIDADKYLPDEFNIAGKNIYLCVANGYGNSKLNNNLFESKLKVTATTRNMKTVNKLIELSS